MKIRRTSQRITIPVIVLTLAGWSCRHRPANDTAALLPAVGPDTVRGIVSIVGNEPQTTVSLTTADHRTFVVRGAAVSDLRAVPNIDVTLFGTVADSVSDGSSPRPTPLFMARAFLVRAVQGVAAVDGTLVRNENGFALRHINGTLTVLHVVPEALQAYVGARIFWVGAFDAPPAAYGVIAPGKP